MTTIPTFHMTAPSFGPEHLEHLARRLGADGAIAESAGSMVVNSTERVLVAAAPCSRQPGVLMYVDGTRGLGQLYERPIPAEEASREVMHLLSELELLPSGEDAERHQVTYEPVAQVTEAVVFDGRERKPVPARTDFRLRLSVAGVPVNGPRTRVRAAFGDTPEPIFFYRALWSRLEVHEEVDLVPEEDVVAVAQRSLQGRKSRTGAMRVHSSKLVYMADDFRGAPDLLTPTYLLEIEGPGRVSNGSADLHTPRQLLRIPAWRSAA